MILLEPPPGAKFSGYDVVKALFKLESMPYGRSRLMQAMGLSEASTRSLMDKLKDAGYAGDSTKGLLLSKKGKSLVSNLHKKVLGPASVNAFGQVSIAFLVRRASCKIKIGLEERDIAVRAGADGALVLVCSGNKLKMPGAGKFKKENEKLFEELQDKLKPHNKDVIIMAFSSSEQNAGAGAWAAVKRFL